MRLNLVLARATLFGFFITLFPAVASADWIYAPFVGAAFGGSTTLLDLEFGGASSTQLIFGGSAGWWSAGIIGFETDFSYAPRFFETDNQAGLVTNSNLITWGGNVVVAVPDPLSYLKLPRWILLERGTVAYDGPSDAARLEAPDRTE